MKKRIAYILIATLMMSLTACTPQAEQTANAQNDTEQTQTQEKEVTQESIDSMVEPADALVRCMLENGLEYEPKDPVFFWTALSYFVGAYGAEHTLAQVDDESITLPRKAVQEMAIAMFADYDDLLELPEEVSARVTYDESLDAYRFGRGDIGLCETKLTLLGEENGNVQAEVKLISTMEDKDIIGTWEITMTENTYADGIENPKYLYSISDVVPVEIPSQNETQNQDPETKPVVEGTTVTATFGGLSDGHTAEMTLSDGSFGAFQFTDETVAEQLTNANAGDVLTFTYTQDSPDGVKMIVAIQ